MFGHRFWGARYYGPRYWGDGGDTAAVATDTDRAGDVAWPWEIERFLKDQERKDRRRTKAVRKRREAAETLERSIRQALGEVPAAEPEAAEIVKAAETVSDVKSALAKASTDETPILAPAPLDIVALRLAAEGAEAAIGRFRARKRAERRDEEDVIMLLSSL